MVQRFTGPRQQKIQKEISEHDKPCRRSPLDRFDGRALQRGISGRDLNMVRAGVVTHPSAWRWCSHAELMGARVRYRILSIDKLVDSLGGGSVGDMRASYAAGLNERLASLGNCREPQWTEALAVGSKDFVCAVQGQYRNRCQFVVEQSPTEASGETWTVREPHEAYDAI
jgi:hypothetical protein